MCVVESDVCHVVTNRFGVLDTYWLAKSTIFLRVFHVDNAESFWVKKVRDNFILRCASKDRAEPLLILQTTDTSNTGPAISLALSVPGSFFDLLSI